TRSDRMDSESDMGPSLEHLSNCFTAGDQTAFIFRRIGGFQHNEGGRSLNILVRGPRSIWGRRRPTSKRIYQSGDRRLRLAARAISDSIDEMRALRCRCWSVLPGILAFL